MANPHLEELGVEELDALLEANQREREELERLRALRSRDPVFRTLTSAELDAGDFASEN